MRRVIPRLLALLLILVVLVTVVLAGGRVWYRFHPPIPLRDWLPSSTAVLDDQGRLLRLTLAADQQYRLWTPLDQLSPTLVQAVLLHEDRHFYLEPGFNPYSLLRGAFKTYVLRRHPQGGSTITMQLARLLWHLDTRSPWGKMQQVARAIQLELQYSKQAILEAYLNDAPFGGNIQGVGAASLIYFDHAPLDLSLPESLALAVMPQNPSVRGRVPAGLAGPELLAARNRLFRRWAHMHPVSASERALFALPMTLRPADRLPFRAPWFVDQLLADRMLLQPSSLGLPDRDWIHSTVDLRLQRAVDRQVQAYVAQQAIRGVHNAAALLVDTRDMGIKALIGSADYFDTPIAGQVNGTNAKRSPGSALKPFIYGLGFDQGIVIPATVLRDVPTAYGAYAPENFDGRFEGPVTVTQALIRSRNIPALDVAAQLSHPDFYHFLQSAGIADLARPEHYGLALVLGGGEVTMQEMAKLYAMLANQGVIKPLRFVQAASNQTAHRLAAQGTRLLSRAASFMVLDILRQNPPPGLAPTGQPSPLPVAWKTGTSSSFRDAWSVGVFGPYVLVVWVGNFDGSPNPAFVGGEMAGPLFFNIVAALKAENPGLHDLPAPIPPRLRKVLVCLSSGALPTAWCPRTGESWFIPGVSPIRVDDVYRPVMVNRVTGAAVCPPFDPVQDERKVFAYWPSDLQQLFALAGIPRTQPPRSPACGPLSLADTIGGSPPQITSPLAGNVYTQQLTHPAQARIPLTVTTDADVHRVYWFADKSYIGQAEPGQTLFWSPSQPGSYTIRAVDDHGRADERLLRVARVP
ncbi:penicillin-binding protein 1C [Halothiobacillus diazotrophicus]|uniref:peptidoglycan glycosyltransferase n=1 Tax=Halothiobacillus diazotrophicus TaxID=1860122 RepID=A0A191ZK81_9GAMM|nr:penicillin-binding protein 1C [Halothiobacillus diazotrophicus]